MPTTVKMYVRLQKLPDDFSLVALRSEFLKAFSLDEKEDFYFDGPLTIIGEEDRPYMPVNDEHSTWLNVNLSKAYYGVGYERGNPQLFVRYAEWFEERLPNCQVYYGHDVNDENVSLFDKSTRKKLMEYYQRVGNLPYRTESPEEKRILRNIWQQINSNLDTDDK